jgi:predicted dehydrogenase
MADEQTPGLSRRDFLKTTAGTTAGAVAGAMLLGKPGEAAGAPAVDTAGRILGANDRINFGLVGVKGMGGGHLRNLVGELSSENIQITAICDVWDKVKRQAGERAGLPDTALYGDYRKMLERTDIDAVVVATPDQTHAEIAIAAMKTGRHVYCEKPMTHTLDEAFEMYDVAKRTGRLVQVGSHGSSDPTYLRARELVKTGVLGRMLWAQGSFCRNAPTGEWNYQIDPECTERTVDWTRWLGPAPKRPFSAERFFRWRKYWDYGNGIIGDLWPHRLHPLVIAMNLVEFPRTVTCIGGNLCETDKGPGPDGRPWGERREVADTTMATIQFPSGVMIFLAGATTNERGIEEIIRGHRADLLLGGSQLELLPQRPFIDEIEGRDETPPDAGESHAKHMRNFIVSMRDNTQPNCHIELGIRVQTIVTMAEVSYRTGRSVTFDERGRRII